MKLYKLRFTNTEFTNKASTIWRTDIIDLYDNNQYSNYSSRKSNYGSNLLGNGVYTGINSSDGITSEIGHVDGDRFIDESGRIDLVSWKGKFNQTSGGEIPLRLNVYSTDDSTLTPYYAHATPSEIGDWAVRRNLAPGDLVLDIGSFRYCFFEIELDSEEAIDTSAEVELIISVEIDPPVINGFFSGTRKVLDKFPEWMELREYDPLDLTDAEKATPTKVGSQFINAVSGEWITDLRAKISYQEFQKNIETVDLGQKAWIWKTENVPVDVFSVTFFDGATDIQLTNVASISEFYESLDSEHVYFLNPVTKEIYTNNTYAEGVLKINGTAVNQVPHQAWNAIDDFGVAVDLYRLPLENNDSFRKRILDVYRSSPGVSGERFKLALRRELNLWKYSGATPDSDFVGATPEVLEFEDIENNPAYYSADGIPTKAFHFLIEKLAHKYPMTWGLFRFGEALWDIDGLYHKGFSTIPKQWDATPVSLAQYQSGVGDINDLKVLPPNFYQPEQVFDVVITARGRRSTIVPTYTEIPVDLQVTGLANDAKAEYPDQVSHFHITLTISGVAYYANVELTAAYFAGDPDTNSIYNYSPGGTWPPPSVDTRAKGYFDWIGPNGFTSSALSWYRQSDNTAYLGDFPTSPITSLKITPGKKDTQTGAIGNTPNDDLYKLKIADSAITDFLGASSGNTQILLSSITSLDDSDYRLVIESWDYAATPNFEGGFKSISQSILATVNKGEVNNPAVVSVGNFNFPVHNGTGVQTQKVFIQLVERNTSNEYGAYTSSGLFIPASYIYVNGVNSWVNGSLTLTIPTNLSPGQSFQLTISCATFPEYPENKLVWQSFKETYTALIDQVVNEHGPYRYGQPPQVGNTSNILKSLRLSYADFGLTGGIGPSPLLDENGNPILGDYGNPILTSGGISYFPLLDDDGNPILDDYGDPILVAWGAEEQITWIGVESVNNPNVLVWTNTNAVIPLEANAGDYPEGSLVESVSSVTNLKVLSPLLISAKIKSNLNPKMNPYIHSGWFYEDQQQYFMFAEPETATVPSFGYHYGDPLTDSSGNPVLDENGNPILVTGGISSGLILSHNSTPTQAYQGAPVIAYQTNPLKVLRQVPNVSGSTPSDGIIFTEVKTGTGINSLFAGYTDISNIVVTDLTSNSSVALVANSSISNEIKTVTSTSRDREYEISYKIENAFYTDHLSTPGITKVDFSTTPGMGNNFIVTWENAKHLPATPIEIPLSPLYSSMSEGFLYIDNDEHDLAYLEVSISPSSILATPGDYTMVTVHAYDKNGNPKPNVNFAINNFAGLTAPTYEYITDQFGYCSLYLDSHLNSITGRIRVNAKLDNTGGYVRPNGAWTPGSNPSALIALENATSASPDYISSEVEINVEKLRPSSYSISAVMDSSQIYADGSSGTFVFGIVKDASNSPVPYATVAWKRARAIKALLQATAVNNPATPGQSGMAGRVYADADGRFVIGPFISHTEPGYWLLSVESSSVSPAFLTNQFPKVGDITYWNEFLNVTNTLDPASLSPVPSAQQSTPIDLSDRFMATPSFPVTMDEDNYIGTPTSAAPNWLPPSWFPLSVYEQYQLGLLGSGYYSVTTATPPYNDRVSN